MVFGVQDNATLDDAVIPLYGQTTTDSGGKSGLSSSGDFRSPNDLCILALDNKNAVFKARLIKLSALADEAMTLPVDDNVEGDITHEIIEKDDIHKMIEDGSIFETSEDFHPQYDDVDPIEHPSLKDPLKNHACDMPSNSPP